MRIAGHLRSSQGYSLVELILVVAIIGVLSGLAIPRYGRAASRYRADAAAKRVVADLQQAQQRGLAGSGACVLSFSTSAATLTMTYPTIGGVAGRSVQTKLGLLPYLASIQSVDFGGTSSVTFDGNGRPSAGGTIVIRSGNESRTITVAAGNGATTIN